MPTHNPVGDSYIDGSALARTPILIADDDADLRDLISKTLDRAGFDVTEAEDGQRAFELFAERWPHIVLLDANTPGVDGFGACSRIRSLSRGAETPILMVTGEDDEESIRRAFEVGATDFMSKPFDNRVLAQRILDSVSQSATLGGHEVFVKPSIGIAVYPDHGRTSEELLRHADRAMYHAKSRGRDRFQHYDRSMDNRSAGRLELENDLRKAQRLGQLRLYFQPKVSLRSGRLLGAEALLRWQHPKLGLMSPGHFIPLAEETSLIRQIGRWVMVHACTQAQKWRRMGHENFRIAINVSSNQFLQDGFVEWIAVAIRESGVAPALVELELTESAIMEHAESDRDPLRTIKNLGLGLAADDFGTGYSSLSYIKRLPIDTVKIDQFFIRDLSTSPHSRSIIEAIVSMAQTLRLNVVAEGVETIAQLQYLQTLGCEEAQGYLFGRPLPADSFGQVLGKSSFLPSTEPETTDARELDR